MTSELCTRIVVQHGGLVKAACLRILRDEGLAEDAAQETFVLLVRKARALPPDISLPGWLYHTACRTALNHHRTVMRRRARESSPEAVVSTVPESSPAAWVELEPQLDEAMLALSERQRDLVVQCYFQNQPQRSAARTLGVSESVVSRELGAAIEALRRFFARRGVTLGGAALVALLMANGASAATLSTPLIAAAMVANATSATASTTVAIATTAGGTVTPFLVALKLKIALGTAAAVLIGAAGYDLASKDSYLQRWIYGPTVSQPVGVQHSRDMGGADSEAVAALALKKRLLAEARDIWAKARKAESLKVDTLVRRFGTESDADKQFAILRDEMGIGVSRAAFNKDRPALAAQLEKRSNNSLRLFGQMVMVWAKESPREAVAWAHWLTDEQIRKELAVDWMLDFGIHAIQSEVVAWAAFIEVSPDPLLEARTKLWLREDEEPGSIWAGAGAMGITTAMIQSHVERLFDEDTPARSLQRLLACPSAAFKRHAIAGIAAKLPPDELKDLATRIFAYHPPTANFLRAIAGDPVANFSEGASFALNAPRGKYVDSQLAGWTRECVKQIYAHWAKIDASAAVNQAVTAGDREYLELCMVAVAQSGQMDEKGLMQALTDVPAGKRDGALSAFYRAQSVTDPAVTLQRIITSESVADQVDAARPVLVEWAKSAPHDAAAWLAALPPSDGHVELAATIASEWVKDEFEPAIAFACQQKVRLTHGFLGALAVAIRNQPDSDITTLLRPLRDDAEYDDLIVTVAGYRSSHPVEAFRFIAAHAVGDWQNLMVDDVIYWLKGEDIRAERFTQALPMMDLSKVSTQRLVTMAPLYAKRLGDDKMAQALDWTLRIPVSAALLARAEVITKADLANPVQRSALTNWVKFAAIGAEERGSLLGILNQKMEVTRSTSH